MIHRAFTSVLACITLAVACVDTTPLYVDAKLEDASLPTADSSASSACRECLEGDAGACHTEFALCKSLPGCPPLIDCVLDLGCFALPLLEDRIDCGQPCLTQFNLTSADPALPGILGINTCSYDACRSACVIE
ncbi:MAG TPA: hypothetical protein VHU80_24130 [Polyangiaceae bacterium]|jgi:hypothetical protein|nr:hypothetical protein [Polyangiaceae bacterium]